MAKRISVVAGARETIRSGRDSMLTSPSSSWTVTGKPPAAAGALCVATSLVAAASVVRAASVVGAASVVEGVLGVPSPQAASPRLRVGAPARARERVGADLIWSPVGRGRRSRATGPSRSAVRTGPVVLEGEWLRIDVQFDRTRSPGRPEGCPGTPPLRVSAGFSPDFVCTTLPLYPCRRGPSGGPERVGQ